jgi:hypothetical protein
MSDNHADPSHCAEILKILCEEAILYKNRVGHVEEVLKNIRVNQDLNAYLHNLPGWAETPTVTIPNLASFVTVLNSCLEINENTFHDTQKIILDLRIEIIRINEELSHSKLEFSELLETNAKQGDKIRELEEQLNESRKAHSQLDTGVSELGQDKEREKGEETSKEVSETSVGGGKTNDMGGQVDEREHITSKKTQSSYKSPLEAEEAGNKKEAPDETSSQDVGQRGPTDNYNSLTEVPASVSIPRGGTESVE